MLNWNPYQEFCSLTFIILYYIKDIIAMEVERKA